MTGRTISTAPRWVAPPQIPESLKALVPTRRPLHPCARVWEIPELEDFIGSRRAHVPAHARTARELPDNWNDYLEETHVPR